MSENELADIAEHAKMIVDGYAFTQRADGFVSILKLSDPDSAMVVDRTGALVETNMDLIEQRIVMRLCEKNLHFMEE